MKDKGIKLSNDFWIKPKVKKLQFFKGLFNLVKNAATFNWISVPADAIDVIDSIKLEDKAEKIGWILISRAIADALLNLIVENYPTIDKKDIVTEELDSELDKLLENKDLFVEVDFFNHPEKLLIIDEVKPIFSDFLELFKFDRKTIENILLRFKSYFVFSLINEWRRNYKYYQTFAEALRTPFDEAAKREYSWFVYNNWLNKLIDKPVFNESFGLKQVYIPLRAYYKVKVQSKHKEKTNQEFMTDKKYKRIVIDIETELLNWLKKSEKNDAIRIIRGGPGYGKSSFLKMLAVKLSKEGKKVIFVPLHLFEVKDDFTAALQRFIKIDGLINIDPFEEEDLVILFDGLDELSMQGSILADVANRFLREVEKNVAAYNNIKTRLQVIISGRDVVVQQNESEFRKDGQILRLLPYYLTDIEKEDLEDQQKLLDIDQRDLWWKKYGKANGKNYKELPKNLKNIELDEITAQPLLNYLVALSYERGKIIFSADTNLNELYQDLLEAVFERSYSEGKRLDVICKFKLPEFNRILEEIATATWHGDSRTTTVENIEQHFIDSGLKKLLDDFIKDAEKGVISLLAAFYFRQADQTVSGTQTFEFTHKSFGEYLTAKKIINKVSQIHGKLIENDECYDNGWNIKDCLSEWIKLFSPRELDSDLVKFIRNEFVLVVEENVEENNDILVKLQNTIIRLINYILKYSIPMQNLNPRPSFKIENEQAINSEKALLIVLSIISQITKIISNIEWPNIKSFGDWVSRLAGQRQCPNIFILNYFDHLNISNCVLDIKDFYNTNLEYSILTKSSLLYINLMEADLRGAHLAGADLEGADLKNVSGLKSNK